jgi:hypothetical protein
LPPGVGMPPKRKTRVFTDDNNLNDGSGSDNSDVGYQPRQAAPRIHYMQDESTTVTTVGGRIRYNKSTMPTPTSPAKKTQQKIREAPTPSQIPDDNMRESWDTDFADFDAEYGPGLEKEACDLRDSVSIVIVLESMCTGSKYRRRIIPMDSGPAMTGKSFLTSYFATTAIGNQLLCAGLGCAATAPSYRCTDCIHPCLYCKECIKADHSRVPLHHIEVREPQAHPQTRD